MEEKTIICSERKPLKSTMIKIGIPLALVVIFFVCIDSKFTVFGEVAIASYIPVLAAIYWVLRTYYSSCEIVVTDKRVYGKAIFGKRVDLPIDSISAVGTSILSGIEVGSSSGGIKFKFIENNEKIHAELSKLLVERQSAGKSAPAPVSEPTSGMDDLKKLKELLDSGVITQEEFDAKKKQILGL